MLQARFSSDTPQPGIGLLPHQKPKTVSANFDLPVLAGKGHCAAIFEYGSVCIYNYLGVACLRIFLVFSNNEYGAATFAQLLRLINPAQVCEHVGKSL